jgi:hypothetical protein
MSINTIEIICIPCSKCERVKNNLMQAIKNIEVKYKTKIIYELKQTPNLQNITRYNLNPSQAPAVLVNGNPEFAGNIETINIQNKLDMIHRS